MGGGAEEDLPDDFFSDGAAKGRKGGTGSPSKAKPTSDEEEDEATGGNPLVAGDASDLDMDEDVDEDVVSSTPKRTTASAQNHPAMHRPSDEDEDEGAAGAVGAYPPPRAAAIWDDAFRWAWVARRAAVCRWLRTILTWSSPTVDQAARHGAGCKLLSPIPP
jgi:hypothetical protein